jgi:DivIVA domain-containing protein
MNSITKKFNHRSRGYDESQVDSYIQKLTYEYDRLLKQHVELSSQHELLQKESKNNTEFISDVLVRAEISAQKIIAGAQDEAARIIGGAHVELKKLQQNKVAINAEISNMADRLRGLFPSA